MSDDTVKALSIFLLEVTFHKNDEEEEKRRKNITVPKKQGKIASFTFSFFLSSSHCFLKKYNYL